jgi:hypothetical protein
VTGEEQLRLLAERLKAAGSEGQGLRRELMKQITEAAKPLTEEIASLEHLKPYLPDRYAKILSGDLTVSARRIFAKDPRVSIQAKAAREKRRKVRWLDQGFINHPIYARGARDTWNWVTGQTGGMRPGFFTDACKDAAPDIREKVLQALTETSRKITSSG